MMQSINENACPSNLKLAIVSPVYRSGHKQDASNYWHVSILPAISAVTEKVVGEQPIAHLYSTAFFFFFTSYAISF